MRRDQSDALALGLVALLVLLLFQGIVFRGRILYERDINAYFYPFAAVFARIVGAGSWPLWNPYVAFGQPLLANPQFEVFYPPTWLIPYASPWSYYSGFVVFHCVVAGTGAYALCRTIGLSTAAAFVGAAAWVTCGPWLSLVNLWHHMAGAAWIPWTLAAAERCFRAPRLARALAWGTLQGVQLLAGSADMAIMSAVLAGGRLIAHLAASRDHRAWRSLATWSGVAVVAALGLAAAQWIPTFELAARSARRTLAEADQAEMSAHPLFLLQTVVPVPFKELRLGTVPTEMLFQSREPLLFSLYLGLPAAGLVAAALAGRGTPWRSYAIAGLVLGAFVALGRYTPVHGGLLLLAPPLRMLRYPVKVMAVVGLLWSLLAAAGLDQVRAGGRRAGLASSLVLALGGTAVLGLACALQAHPIVLLGWVEPQPDQTLGAALTPLVHRLTVSGVLALLTAGLLAWSNRGRFLYLVVTCVVADLFTFHVNLNPTAPAGVLSFRPPILDFFSGAQESRVYTFDYSLPSRVPGVTASAPYLLAVHDVREAPGWLFAVAYRTYLYPTLLGIWGLEGSYDRDYQSFFPPYLAAMTRVVRAAEGLPAQLRLLQMGAVGRVVTLHASGFPGLVPLARLPALFRAPILVYAVPDPLPRSYVVGEARVASDPAAIGDVLSVDFDPRRQVVLAPGNGSPPPPAPALEGPAGHSRITLRQPDRVRVEVEAGQAAFVVLVDAYDPGWRATVDGRPAPVLRANVTFRAVAVDAGPHVVEFLYRPRSVFWGLATSALTLVAILITAGRSMRRRRHASPVESRVAAALGSSAPRSA